MWCPTNLLAKIVFPASAISFSEQNIGSSAMTCLAPAVKLHFTLEFNCRLAMPRNTRDQVQPIFLSGLLLATNLAATISLQEHAITAPAHLTASIAAMFFDSIWLTGFDRGNWNTCSPIRCSSWKSMAVFLGKIDCVQDVKVDLEKGQAIFVCTNAKFDKAKFLQTINGLGFKAELEKN